MILYMIKLNKCMCTRQKNGKTESFCYVLLMFLVSSQSFSITQWVWSPTQLGDGGASTSGTQGDKQPWHYNSNQFKWFSTMLQYAWLFITQVSCWEAENAVFWVTLEWKSANWADVNYCPSGPAILEAAGELLIGGQHRVALVTMITCPPTPKKQLGRRAGKHPPHWLQLSSLFLIS